MATKKKVTLPQVTFTPADVAPEKQDHFASKGPVCDGCALVERPRIVGRGDDAPVDIMLVSESPTWASAENKTHFNGKGGRVIKETWKKLLELDRRTGGTHGFAKLRRFETYAVQCQADEDNKKDSKFALTKGIVDRCAPYLHAAIRQRKPKIILTFGSNALKATGIKSAGKFDEVRGKLLHASIGGEQYVVLPTFSTRALLSNSGLYNLMRGDMLRAMRIASGLDNVTMTTDVREVADKYEIPGFEWGEKSPDTGEYASAWQIRPTTAEEVDQLSWRIINYAVQGATPQTSSISVDTETNTLHSHRHDAKVLCISFAWDVGKSTAIPLWHQDAPWSPEDFEVVLRAVKRILDSSKPKIFHNAKFDLKFLERRHGLTVNNVGWCSLGGEHLVQPEQQGSYSLKVLGRSYFPQFANYADRIHERAAALGEEDQRSHDYADTWERPKKPPKATKKNPNPWQKGDLDPFLSHELVLTKKALTEYLKGPTDKKELKKRHEALVNYEKVPLAELLLYAALDTDLTRRLFRNQWLRAQEVDFAAQARQLMKTHVIPASRTLGGMEYGGIRVNQDYLGHLKEALPKVSAESFAEMQRHWNSTWGEFNPNSTQHLSRLLYSAGVYGGKRWNPAWGDYDVEKAKKLGRKLYTEGLIDPNAQPELRLIPGVVEKNEKSGVWKTDKKTLRAIVEHTMRQGNPCLFTVALLDYRSAHKAESGFLTEIEHLSSYDGRLHTNFHIQGTATGRLSSSGMNLQNWPTWIAGFNLKKLLIPDDPDDEVIVNLDYKGAEVKIFAAYSGDTALIESILAGMDTHCFFLSQIYGVPYEEALAANEDRHPDKARAKELKAQRTIIKRVVFGILYGAGAKKIAETAGVSLQKAQETIDLLLGMFPSIKKYVEDTREHIRTHGYVETFFGRRRPFPLYAVNSFFRSQAERRGVNMKIQSTSSDIVMGQLVELDQHIAEVGGRLALTVHDSMVAVVKKKYVDQLPEFLKYYCVDRVSEKYKWLPVPFACDIEVGPSYGECVPLHKYIDAGALASELAALSDAARQTRLGAMKADKHPLYEATSIRMPDALRALYQPDLERQLEEQFDEEALEELRDFENAKKDDEKPVKTDNAAA